MTQRRIAIIGNIPLPDSLAEAGKLQTQVANAVSAFAAELKSAGIHGDMECKVVTARPAKQKADGAQGSTAQPPLPQVSLLSTERPDLPEAAQPAPAPATPPWAR